MTIDLEFLNKLFLLMRDKEPQGYIEAASVLLHKLGQKKAIPRLGSEAAYNVVRSAVMTYIEKEDFSSASAMCFGLEDCATNFDHVQDILRVCRTHNRCVIFGASGMSKSFIVGTYLFFDYVRDPLYTKIVLASLKESHLKENLFSDLARLTEISTIDWNLDYSVSGLFIRPKGYGRKDVGIFGQSFPKDTST